MSKQAGKQEKPDRTLPSDADVLRRIHQKNRSANIRCERFLGQLNMEQKNCVNSMTREQKSVRKKLAVFKEARSRALDQYLCLRNVGNDCDVCKTEIHTLRTKGVLGKCPKDIALFTPIVSRTTKAKEADNEVNEVKEVNNSLTTRLGRPYSTLAICLDKEEEKSWDVHQCARGTFKLPNLFGKLEWNASRRGTATRNMPASTSVSESNSFLLAIPGSQCAKLGATNKGVKLGLDPLTKLPEKESLEFIKKALSATFITAQLQNIKSGRRSTQSARHCAIPTLPASPVKRAETFCGFVGTVNTNSIIRTTSKSHDSKQSVRFCDVLIHNEVKEASNLASNIRVPGVSG
ncbi:hypothetical protein CAPTEDRAFT_190668 [Capitella teleta]|uniref:Uncharacterized protein n=1 Tax=Capitella teleta TaxID=283909 RepID=R7TCQ6_CAPTE|nr:hypothetical protein CAPTEDRAFT_190668 [Capitella teleta]|eukprot:ELT88856.1 hypothetical protein CAPTEDRAFT_190668 [Capitella teleta]